MAKEYIEREALKKQMNATCRNCDARFDERECGRCGMEWAREIVRSANAADVVEVETVAQMLCDTFGDPCACNYNDNDEWLSAVCDYDFDECPDPADPLGCWKQFIKHYGERRNDA